MSIRCSRLIVLVLLLVSMTSGCTHTKQVDSDSPLPTHSKQQIAEDYDKQGILSKSDYWHLHTIYQTEQNQPLQNEDLEWLINLLQKPSTDPPTKNAKVMAAFLDLKVPPTEQQNQRIVAAVTPLLSSKSELDRNYAASVLKKLQQMKAT